MTVSSVTRQLISIMAVSTVMGVLAAGLVIPWIGALSSSLNEASRTVADAPKLPMTGLMQRSQILDRNGEVIANLYDQNRVTVPLDRISRPMIAAIVAIEDHRYFQHGPLDLQGTLRALVTNQVSGETVQGGSSITQQLVKLTLLSQATTHAERKAATEGSLGRKVRELRYAIGLEQEHSKEWILERYLNLAYFGDGAYGIQSAARHYFSTDASELTRVQAAMLAGLVKNPTDYDPTNDRGAALKRRNTVLTRMAQLGAVPDRTASRLQRRGLGLQVAATQNGCNTSAAPFYCDYVVATLRRDPTLGSTPSQRLRRLHTGGLTVHTALDLRYQRAAEQAVATRVDPTDQAIGALAMIEPGSGEVRALAQSRPMGGASERGQTYVNHLTPREVGGAAGFQGGSTFKAFVLASAIEQGVPLDTTYPTPNTATYDQTAYANCPGEPSFAGTFTVGNTAVPSSGYENLYSGTRLSINTFFLHLEQETGICHPFELARRMGVNLTAPDGAAATLPERVPMFTLGVANASPLEMAEAYATFAARGIHCDAQPLTRITAADGRNVQEYEPACERVLRTSTADAVNDVLRGVVEPGGFAEDQALDQPAAAKTGNNEGLSIWFTGYTPNLAASAVIAGVDEEGQPQNLAGVTVGGNPIYDVSASAYAAPMWGQAMRNIDATLAYQGFAYPTGVAGAGITQPYTPEPEPAPSSATEGGPDRASRPPEDTGPDSTPTPGKPERGDRR